MRLIDADDFFNRMNNDTDLCAEMEFEGLKALKKYLDLQPTSYDVDKVVEELEEMKTIKGSMKTVTCRKWDYGTVNRAIEIVKQGGVAKDCNNCANYTDHDEVDNGCYLCCKGYENNYEPKVDNGDVSDDVCEWKQDNMCKTVYRVCGGCFTSAYQKDFEFCPYCGKKIKVVE